MFKILKIIYLFILFFLFSCSPEIEDAKVRAIYGNKHNLINPFYIDKITHLNYYSINPWFTEKIKKYYFKTISIKYYDNLTSNQFVENQKYEFNNKGFLVSTSYFATKDTLMLVDNFDYQYNNNNVSKIFINKYALIGNQAPISIYRTNEFECYIRERNKNNNDSLFFYPNSQNPEIIKEKIGDFINYLEVFVNKNISAGSFITKVKKIDSTLASFEIAEKIVTYKDNECPLESYHTDNKWNILDKCKEWQYNEYNQPILFMEWHNEKKSKHIELIYNENKILKKYIFNKKKFIIQYKTK